jgi:dTDP-4-dehydrorhamnose 3,5-epimerase
MKSSSTTLPGVLLLHPTIHRDPRGHFLETHKQSAYEALGIPGPFVQDNVSVSAKDTLRGLHFQQPHAQGKLVSVLQGAIYDVAVDIRKGSPTFGQHVAATLTATAGIQLWIPAGFAHGFCALEDDSIVSYKCTAEYAPTTEHTIRWDDPALNIEWPTRTPLLSAKDATAPALADLHLP